MEKNKPSEREERIKKMQGLRDLGIDPYPAVSDRNAMVSSVLSNFDELIETKGTLIIAGRLRSIRAHGNLAFCNIEDETGTMQIALSKKDIGNIEFKNFINFVDIGDFIEVSGTCFLTHKNERTVMASAWKILAKALRPLPDKWHGLKDEEEKLRKRYIDLIFDPVLKERFRKKALFWQNIRQFMIDKGFLEVETPVLENTAGGADARPFVTHHNSFDMDVYLRISMGELWQKRLMVAGFEKTFEIGRQFRNEGVSPEHMQDYTQMEFYWAYADYKKGMDFVQELYRYIAVKTFGGLAFKIGKFNIDFGSAWQTYDYCYIIHEMTGVDINNIDLKTIEKKLSELNITYDKNGFNLTRAIDNLWKYCRRSIAGPGFLTNVPISMEPLAKRMPNDQNLVQRFQVIIAGSEMGKGYSELNDPIDQAERFASQQALRDAGDEEAQMFDQAYIEALEYGMPPTCGFGVSERLFAFLSDQPTRECQLFPLLKPKT
jgi:lysyl-tRNA synthetase, class II